MSDNFADVLAEYRTRASDEAQRMAALGPEAFARRDEFLLEVGEDTANLLQALVVGCQAVRIVELGTSYGYSTLFLAAAAKRTGGTVTTFELSAEKQAYARERIERAGLSDQVRWQCGDAVELLTDLPSSVDFVLIDLWKDLYVPCFQQLRPKLAANAVIVADNMLHPPMVREDAEAYRRAIRQDGAFHSVLLPIGSGIELSCLWGEGD